MDMVAVLQKGQISGLYLEKSCNFSFRTGGKAVRELENLPVCGVFYLREGGPMPGVYGEIHLHSDSSSVVDFCSKVAYHKQLIGQLKFGGALRVLKSANYAKKKEVFMPIFQNLGWTPSNLQVKLERLLLGTSEEVDALRRLLGKLF
jgi:hypothetical protein